MGTKSTLNAKNLRDQLKRILDYVRKNLRFIETDLSISGDTEIHSTLNVKPGGNSVFAVGESQVVINEASNDVDFRVESDAATHMLFVDGGNNRISIGNTTDAPGAVLEVVGAANAGVPLVLLDNDDTDKICLDIDAANIDADVIDITADAVTTAFVMDVTADALTTGGILNLVSDSSDTSDRTLVTVKNDNTAATGTVVMHLVNDAIGGSGDPILLIESTADETNAILELRNSNASTTGEPIIRFVRSDTSAEADDMDLGRIHFDGSDDGNNLTTFATILAEASDITNGTESGKVSLTAMNAGSERSFINYGGEDTANSTPAEVVINEGSIDIDFRVETNATTHALFVDGGSDHVRIDAAQGLHLKDLGGHANTPASGHGVIYVNGDVPYFKTDGGTATSMIAGGSASAPLTLTNASDSGSPALTIDNNDTDEFALYIDAANIDASAVVIAADTITTAHAINISADALTTGTILNLVSDSSDTSSRNLVTIHNNHASATGATPLSLLQDAPSTICLNVAHDNAETNFGPIVVLNRLSSTVADDMGVGLINFQGLSSTDASIGYARIAAFASDVTNGDTGGKLSFQVQANGIAGTAGLFELMSIGGEDVANSTVAAVVVNDDAGNVDFRVEGDTETHLIFSDASVDRVSIGASTDAPAATLEISNASDGGVPLVLLDSNDTDKICLDIDAANIDADVIDITADAVTTAFVMDVTADALTTGGILNLVSDSSDNTARSLVNIINDNSSANNVTCLTVRNDGTMAEGASTVLIHDAGDMAGDNHSTLELRYEGSSAGRQASLEFNQATGNSTDDDDLGQILVTGLDSDDNKENYCLINFTSSDRTSGDEGGKIRFKVAAGGTAGTAGLKELFTIGGEDVANTVVPAVVVNDAGINCDFRVESDGEDEAIFLDASAETLYINKGESAFTTQIHSTNDVAMTVGAAGVIFNEDGHATNDFRVESDNNTHMLFVDAGDDTVTVGADDSLHKDGFAVINDFNGTTFENTLADGQFGSAEILKYSPGADDTLAAGQLFFLHTDGTWDSTDADAVATGATQMLGIGLGGSARTVGCLIKGFIRIPSTEILNLPGSGACDGLPLYVSTTAGHLDFTAPSGNDDFVRIVGYAIDDDSSDVLIYFNPDATHVEITA